MATGDIHTLTTRTVCKQLGGSDHLPVILIISSKGSNEVLRKEPSWNFKKANWTAYRDNGERRCQSLDLTDNIQSDTTLLTDATLVAAKDPIPRGRRKNYKAFWSPELERLHSDLTSARAQIGK